MTHTSITTAQQGSEPRRASWPLIGLAAALTLGLPSAGMAVVGLADGEMAAPGAAFEIFTPSSVDPALAARVSDKARERGIRFTPLGAKITPNSERTVTVAVRVDDDIARAISVRSAIEGTPGTGTRGEIASLSASRFNLGTARGYQSFARTPEVDSAPSRRAAPVNELRSLGMPDLADFAPAKPNRASKPSRLQPRIELADTQVAGRSSNRLDTQGAQSVDLGGSFRLSRKVDVTAGVRLSQDPNRLERLDPLTNSLKDSQAVYVGTQIRF